MLGLAQSGLPRLRVASLQRRAPRARHRARAAAEACSTTTAGRLPTAAGARARARRRLAGRARPREPASRRDDRGRAWRTPAGSSPGRARASGSTAPGPGTRPLADRVKQTLFAILEPELRGRARSWTCSPAAAPAASRRCRAAPRGRCSSSATGAAAAVIARNLGRDAPRGPRRGSSARDAIGWLDELDAAGAAVRPRPGRPAVRRHRSCSGGARAPSGRSLAPGGAGRREALLARRRRRRGSVCWHPSASAGSARRR